MIQLLNLLDYSELSGPH